MSLCQISGFHATKTCHFTGSEFITSTLDYVWVGLRLCMGLARDLWQLPQVCCGTWPQFSNTVPGSISPGTDRGSDFLSLVTERQENQQDVLLFQRCFPHSPHQFSPTPSAFMRDNRLCVLLSLLFPPSSPVLQTSLSDLRWTVVVLHWPVQLPLLQPSAQLFIP